MQKPEPQIWSFAHSSAAVHGFADASAALASSSTTFSACTADRAVKHAMTVAAKWRDIVALENENADTQIRSSVGSPRTRV